MRKKRFENRQLVAIGPGAERFHVIDQDVEVAVVDSHPEAPHSIVDEEEAFVNRQLEAIGLGADFPAE